MDEPVLRSQLRPGVVQLTLSRPDKLNAMSQPLVAALGRQLRELADDLTCRVVVLTGAGRGFCAGLDLDGFGPLPGAENFGQAQQTWIVQRAIAGLIQQIRRMPQPVSPRSTGPRPAAAWPWSARATSGSRRRPRSSPPRSTASA